MSNLILYAEDDENDAFLLQRAFKQTDINTRIMVVEDGYAAIDYLGGTGPYTDRDQHPLPSLVLLDLKMPGKSGFDVLKWIRTTARVSTLPVIVLTSSSHEGDKHRAYLQGANGYLVKPSKFEEISRMAQAIKDYWLNQNCGTALPDEAGPSPTPHRDPLPPS